MSGPDAIEFHYQPEDRILLVVESSHAPDRGDPVNIRGTQYVVIGRSYTVDYAGSTHEQVVCVINLGLPQPT